MVCSAVALFKFALIVAQEDDYLHMRDRKKDGRRSIEESRRAIRNSQSEETLSCLDGDKNGFVSKRKKEALRNDFFRSRLSKLTTEEVVRWIDDDRCVPVDMKPYIPNLKSQQITGPALWDVCVRDPSLLLTELKIEEANVRRTIVQEN